MPTIAPTRYLHLLTTQLRLNLATATRYRVDFFGAGAMTLFWMVWNFVPLLVLFSERDTVAGWDRESALLLVAFFVMLRGLLNAVVEPSLTETIDKIRTGSFDYTLLKPVDAQFLASTARFDPWRFFDVVAGLGLAVYSCASRAVTPDIAHIALGLTLLGAGAITMYSLWLVAAALSFFVVRLDNLMYLLESIFDVARWPVQVFRGIWRIIFTFVIPVAVMTTFPAMAVLGTLSGTSAFIAILVSLVMFAASRWLWLFALRNYTSASS
jgi:ABC-2 type transport system permease protein